jgi:hypothetical protein
MSAVQHHAKTMQFAIMELIHTVVCASMAGEDLTVQLMSMSVPVCHVTTLVHVLIHSRK